jgi:3-hydroxybutyryl-CoA dehydratase
MAETPNFIDQLGISIGLKTFHVKTVTEDDIKKFAEVSGDYNRIHMDEEFAKGTFFKGRIAHGILTVSFLSAAAAKLPGLPVVLSFTGKFLRPVHIGDTVRAEVEVTNMHKERGILTLKSTCTNHNGEVLLEGEVLVKIFEPPPYEC